MLHKEMITALAHSTGLTRAMTKRAYDATIAAIMGSIKKGDMIQFDGFGTFYVGQRVRRNGRNPRTGATILIKDAKIASFRASRKTRWY